LRRQDRPRRAGLDLRQAGAILPLGRRVVVGVQQFVSDFERLVGVGF